MEIMKKSADFISALDQAGVLISVTPAEYRNKNVSSVTFNSKEAVEDGLFVCKGHETSIKRGTRLDNILSDAETFRLYTAE